MRKKMKRVNREQDVRQMMTDLADRMEADLGSATGRIKVDEELEQNEDILRRLYEFMVLSLGRIKQRRRAAMGL